jgi:death-on-curing protein
VSRAKWLTTAMVVAIHDEVIVEFGGLAGVRDAGLLESAIERARNRHEYDSASDVFALAAALGFGLTKNHAFNDGNKRTALLAMRAFLYLNGQELEPPEKDEVETMVALADGSLDEKTLALWLRRHSSRR